VSESLSVKVPRAFRRFDRALVAGVAAGLAAHSRYTVWAVRVAFVLASFWKFSGAVAYAVLWLVLPRQEKQVPIGLVAAERQGLRTVMPKTRWPQVAGWVGSCLIGVGIAFVIRLYDTSAIGQNAVGISLVGIGVGLVWLTRETGWPRWGKAVMSVLGVLMVWAVGTFVQADIWSTVGIDMDEQMERLLFSFFIAGTSMVVCLALILPWIVHPARSEEDKQAELIAQTRADMAAHLHDSVLQTLAVIQKRSTDPKAVSQLARSQEKELREWLYGEHVDDESATSALKDVIAELEATHQVAVELVTVGDHEMTVEIDAVVRAAREAILNAAKHSGADKIDVYAEISTQRAEAYIRDRGCGFEMDDVDQDRLGIRRSIIDRMARYGGKVDVRSTVGEGTEIHLSMPLDEEGTGHG